MTVKHYNDPVQIARISKLCLKYKVFSPWGTMQNWYAAPEVWIKAMFLARVQGIPVGCFVILKDGRASYYNCGTYVKDSERRKGIGKSMIALAKKMNYTILPWKASPIANSFYSKVMKENHEQERTIRNSEGINPESSQECSTSCNS